MTTVSLDTKPIMSALTSIALKTGLFGKVNEYEPRGQPPNGLTLALITGPLTPVTTSGLNNASLRWQIDGQIYQPLNIAPEKDIDFRLTKAAAGYLEALCANFTLGGLVRCIDVFGSDGDGLSATPGYLETAGKTFRVSQLLIPLIINQRWELTP